MYIRLKNLREDNDLTQRQIAEYLHCSQSAYSRIESGRQDIPTLFLKQLARLYKVTTDYLLEMDK
ncbi:TPA: helix-turn-helix transcriptional regulator [Streptococcus equi subsp. zooepidemicus]|uniref:helix-turn-helix domain-containing protein n=1 Tax=Streptococcus equi TaxID=1336 RepID=UPI0005BBB3C0|nr:helix-turn-helix transcriptional regulator [Streptococcus equi]KIS06556.1 Cro/CI family transcriptional regulator [Streptococcus equi subsp. zooepidemicus Sz5]MCD3391459.1 helix-turn-helix domain-containing protein [Streptococcus equi subsp. zooepidemicus]MCD3393429.1 helix-turn-helix domain-containing protein [Streptococcus equi subsp. zooepidemicus]MCD3395985.1 helix-turn-helix domain-containing protein [Streptococcus equi subsp. zooepidemicus]MCD3408133.1 helix-turn-helix domain-containi